MTKTAGVVLVCLCALAAGCRLPSERACYRLACAAALAEPSCPDGAVMPPIGEASVQVAKNAARVDLACEVPSGEPWTCTVWLKRIARRWEVDRCLPGPDLPPARRPPALPPPTNAVAPAS